MPDSLEKLDLLLLTVAKSRKVRRDGIWFLGMRYLDTTLAAYVGESVIIRYGPPGVGKTLSARHYANWKQIEAYSPYGSTSDAEPAALIGSDTVFYTSKVVNSPRQIEQDLAGSRGGGAGEPRHRCYLMVCWISDK